MKSYQCQVVQEKVKNAFKDQKNLKKSLVQIALENLLCKFLLSILDYLWVQLLIAAKDNITVA